MNKGKIRKVGGNKRCGREITNSLKDTVDHKLEQNFQTHLPVLYPLALLTYTIQLLPIERL